MKLVLHEPEVFKNMISILSELVNECKIGFNKTEIKILAMDPANVAMSKLVMKSDMFQEYSVEKDEEIAVNIGNFRQILKRIGADDNLTLQSENNKLTILIEGKSKRTFSIPIIELDDKETKEPTLEYTMRIMMPSKILLESMEDVAIVGDSLQFIAAPDKFVILAEGDLNTAKIDIPQTEDGTVKVMLDTKDGEKITSKYSLDYLKRMVTASKIAEQVSVRFKKDFPLTLQYKQGNYEISFILAPRVEN